MTMTAAKRLDCFPVMKIINGQLMNRISFQIKSRVKRCSLCERWASAALAAHLWAVTRRNGCTAARGPTCDLSASGPFINRVGQKLSTHFLLSHFRRHLQQLQQLHHFVRVPAKPRIISHGGYVGSLWSLLSNLPSLSSRRRIPVLIWWHHLCSLIMTNHPLNHSLGCCFIANWAFLCETTEGSVIVFVRREKGEEIKRSPAYNLHTVVTFPFRAGSSYWNGNQASAVPCEIVKSVTRRRCSLESYHWKCHTHVSGKHLTRI